MSYFEQSKLKEETLVLTESVSKSLIYFMFGFGVILILFGLASLFLSSNFICLVFGVVLSAYSLILRLTTEYVITNKRILIKTGFIQVLSTEIKISKIESISIHQTILGRILNYGTLIISGAGNPVVKIDYVPSPIFFKKTCLEQSEIK